MIVRDDGGVGPRMVGYVVANPGAAIDDRRLRERLRAELPDYMVPAAFVALDQLPLTPNGKIDRAALPAPKQAESAGAAIAPPRNPTEESLAAIWREVLKLERVGIHEDFFELGGHSLLAVTLVERMRQAGLQADVRALFARPTIAQLASCTGSSESLIEVPPNLIPNINTELIDSSENVELRL